MRLHPIHPVASSLAALALSLLVVSARADDLRIGATQVRFASVAEGRAVLGSNDAWIEATSDFQRAALLGVAPPVAPERFLAFEADTVQAWPAAQQERWQRALKSIAPRLVALRVPFPPEVLLIDSDGRDAAGAPYTRGRAVVLPSAKITGERDIRDDVLLAHELFHVVSRHAPELASRLYAAIGFESVPLLEWPAAWRPLRLANPDAPFDRHVMRVSIAGREAKVMPLLVARRTDLQPGESFFAVMDVRLLEVDVREGRTVAVMRDGEPVWHAPGAVPEFLEKLGGNTGYIIHPEETMADNFAFLVTRKTVKNAALLERIEAILVAPR